MTQVPFRRPRFSKEDWDQIDLVLGDKQIVCPRGRLGTHLTLGMLMGEYLKKVEGRDPTAITKKVIQYIGIALAKSEEETEELVGTLSFQEVAKAFLELWNFNCLETILPFVRKVEGKKVKNPPWYYEGREVFFWIHTLACAYGWAREEILELEPEEAMAYFQEIMVNEQLEKEWEYGLSEVSRTYDQSTKQSRFVPLKRPIWMVDREIKVVKLLKKFLPLGVAITGGKEFETQ